MSETVQLSRCWRARCCWGIKNHVILECQLILFYTVEWRSDIFICIPRSLAARQFLGECSGSFCETHQNWNFNQADRRARRLVRARRRLVKSCFFSESGGKCDTVNFGETFYFTWMCWKFHLYIVRWFRGFLFASLLSPRLALCSSARELLLALDESIKRVRCGERARHRAQKSYFSAEKCVFIPSEYIINAALAKE